MFEALCDLVGRGGVVVLSGAGISTDSGIPDYRGPSSARRRPMEYREFVTSPAGRQRYWARSHIGWSRVAIAQPNAAHRAVADLEQIGLIDGVITQNVDRLHHKAGSERIIELHGSLDRTLCLDCGQRRRRLELHHRLEAANHSFHRPTFDLAPDGDAELAETPTEEFEVVPCLDCGGRLKPDVIFFGENVPKPRLQEAQAMVDAASALLVVGSSLAVMSGYRFVIQACRSGIPVAIINRGATRGDEQASIRLDAGLSETLPRLSRRLQTSVKPESVSSTNLGRSTLRSVGQPS